MVKKTFGKLKPTYSFLFNQYKDLRCSKCPKCDNPSHLRKFAFAIMTKTYGMILLGYTSRFCSKCELIVVHKHEIEDLLSKALMIENQKLLNGNYLVVGTVEKKIWQEGLKGEKHPENILNHISDFKREYHLDYKPAGWYRADE